MNNFPSELIYVLVFAALALVQYLLKRFGTLEQHDDASPDEAFEKPYDKIEELPVATALQSVSVEHFGRGQATSTLSAPVRSRFSRLSLMGTRRDLQNSIVIATIVGRCRAYEPHDVRKWPRTHAAIAC